MTASEAPSSESEWIKRQFTRPAPFYLVSDLIRLTQGTIRQARMRRMLIRKGVIEQKIGRGREHVVPFSRLMALWPELWLTCKRAWQERQEGSEEDAA